MLVTDVAALEPTVQRLTVDPVTDRLAAVVVVGDSREEHGRTSRRPLLEAASLRGDGLGEIGVDGYQGFAFHLVVEVAQVGRSLAVVDDAVGRQADGVGDAQSAAHQDQRDQLVAGVVPLGEVVRVLQLGHHGFAQRARLPDGLLREVLAEEHHRRGKGVIPAVLPDGGEEQVQLADQHAVLHGAREPGIQVSEVALQQLPVQVCQPLDGRCGVREELPEGCDRPRAGRDADHPEAGGQAPPRPPFGQGLEPGQRDVHEDDPGEPPIRDAELTQPPDVLAVLGVPAVGLTRCPVPVAAGPRWLFGHQRARRAHGRTSRPVNQPASSSAWRASSALRCP